MPDFGMTRHENCRFKRLSSERRGRAKHLDVDFYFLFWVYAKPTHSVTNGRRFVLAIKLARFGKKKKKKKEKTSFLVSIMRKLWKAPIGHGTERRRCGTWLDHHVSRENITQGSEKTRQTNFQSSAEAKKSTYAECSTLFFDGAQFFAMLWSR